MAFALHHFLLAIILFAFVLVSLSEAPFPPSPFVPMLPSLHKPPFEEKPPMRDVHPPTLPKPQPQPHHPSPFAPFEEKPPMTDVHPPTHPKPQPHHPSPFVAKLPHLQNPPFEKKPTMKDGHYSSPAGAHQSPPLPKVKSLVIPKLPPIHGKVPPHKIINEHSTSSSYEKPHPPLTPPFHRQGFPIFNIHGRSHPPLKKSPPNPVINPPTILL